ncbi:GRB2-associated-binding protein 1 isoform X5 [Heterodontus francisci]|uniref:GRB2-associated-binding protein 1 isoform X5 n=1 Tax=Heterodontus francisci TaxID=7792 RepID=UPI00355B83C2
MSGGDIVYNGWLRKSPPEKKLRRYAWKKRWFVLRSGRLTGDPDVLEYYKNDHAKKPIRVIDLNLCEQVDAGLTFNKKDLENSYIFDIRTIDRVFYLVADTEEEMNKWVRCICDICGFNPTDEDAVKPSNPSGNAVTEVPLSVSTTQPSVRPAVSMGSLPPPYQPISVRHLESLSSQEDPQDYLWLANCESKKPEPASQASSFATEEGDEYLLLEEFESKKHPFHNQLHADSLTKTTSSETDCNDNVPSHKPPAPPASKQALNGFFSQQSFYDSPPPRFTSTSTDSSLYNMPRSYSQDIIAGTCSPLAADSEGDLYVFNAPSRISGIENQMRQMSVCYDIPPTPGGTYQIPRPSVEGTLSQSCSKLEPIPDVPPPRPPKPSLSHDRSPVDTYCVPRSSSEADNNYSIPTSGKALRSNTIGTVEGHWLRKDCGPQDSYDIPRTFSNSVDLGEGFSSYLQKKGMMPLSSLCNEEADQNYVPMDANSPPRLQSVSHSEPIQDTNYVAMTPGPFDFPALGMQVPPPAHMGFRVSPKTPPRRPVPTDCQPPPVDRNLKPDRKVKPAPLEIKPLSEFEELQELAPVRSPVTKTFTREISHSRFPVNPRPASVHSTASSTDSQEDSEENYVAMESAPSTDDPTIKQGALQCCDGGSSLTRSKGDKQQVEYLDLDLDSGKSTPPRKKSNGTGAVAADEKVDYVLVDQERTLALKNTRKAWTDERQSTESETPTKSAK